MATAWCEFVASLGGTPAAWSTNGRAGSSLRTTRTDHFVIRFDHARVRAALMMSCRVRDATFALAIRQYLPPSFRPSYPNYYYYSSYRKIVSSKMFAAYSLAWLARSTVGHHS